MSRARFALVLGAAFFAACSVATAQDARQNKPGEFDFYVLSLSWSPSYCDASAERPAPTSQTSTPQRPDQQCAERPYAFVVRGLWPQYERGSPEYCQVPAPRLDRGAIASMLDLMPAPRLIFREWDRHGTCSGLSSRVYFETVRKARAVVKIPADYLDLKEPLTVTPDAVEEAFVQANPGLTRKGITVGCDNKRLREVRICLSKELAFRECDDVDSRTCRREQVVMPPVRAGKTASARN